MLSLILHIGYIYATYKVIKIASKETKTKSSSRTIIPYPDEIYTTVG